MFQHRDGSGAVPTDHLAASVGGTHHAGHSTELVDNLLPLPSRVMVAAVGDFDLVGRLTQHLHQPVRPGWSCGRCSEPWPCDQARQDLVMDLGWKRVPIYLAVMMEHAAGDLNDARPNQLWERFIEWTYPLTGPQDHRMHRQR
jgi:hypothetical protein